MITVVFKKNDHLSLGVKTEKGIFDVEEAISKFPDLKNVPVTVSQIIEFAETGKEALASLLDRTYVYDSLFLHEESLTYGPCVPHAQKIICIGLNYRRHADECNLPRPTSPILFSKFNNALAGHNEMVRLPSKSSKVDYEAELAIVIGKKAKNVRVENALSYVYGYCTANDFSARDLQMKTSQWLLGKSCDGFSPIGPYLVSKEEVNNPNELRVQTYVNGELRQNSSTSDMIFNCEQLISYISEHLTLYPGDLILTGTPEGVIMGYPEEKQVWLKEGDELSIEIEKLGRLTNKLVKESV
jgi:2-keto-4-pentenoate hydratase/2-oxohepta-3-ene-1,7-dioic acid hydratase in catechol pathway